MLAVIDSRSTVLHNLPKGGVGAEIGVFKGNFSDSLLRVTQPKILHLIDPWKSSGADIHKGAFYSEAQRSQKDMDEMFAEVEKRFTTQIQAGKVVMHRETSESALGAMADASLDWVYVDGDHTEGAVSADLELAFKTLRRGGLLCGDDYILGSWWGAGVVRAANRFIGRHAEEVSIIAFIDTQFIIRKL